MAQDIWILVAVFLLFCAGCAVAVWLQFRRTEEVRREAEHGSAELEALATDVIERMPDDTTRN